MLRIANLFPQARQYFFVDSKRPRADPPAVILKVLSAQI
jgi:hypothetical protein